MPTKHYAPGDMPVPLAGIDGSPGGGPTRSTESAKSVNPVGRVGRPKCRSRSTEKLKSVDQNRQGSRVVARRRPRYRHIDFRNQYGRLRFPLFAKSGKLYRPIIRIRARSHCLRPDVQSFRKSTRFNANGIGLKVAPVGRHCRTSNSKKLHQRLSLVTPATRRGRTSNSEKLHQ